MRIYYSGDMANSPGWFTATPNKARGYLQLVEEPGGEDRTLTVLPHHVGNVYAGHCNPRFVTEAAYKAYYRSRGVAK